MRTLLVYDYIIITLYHRLIEVITLHQKNTYQDTRKITIITQLQAILPRTLKHVVIYDDP